MLVAFGFLLLSSTSHLPCLLAQGRQSCCLQACKITCRDFIETVNSSAHSGIKEITDGPTPRSMWVAQVRRDGLFIKKIKEDMMSVGGRKVEVDLERVKGRVVGKYDQNTLYEILKELIKIL